MNVRPSAIIFREDSILTLCYCYSGTEVYALPGGNPDPGENLASALQRELHEELRITTQVGEMVCCGEVIWPEINKETLHIVFLADITEGEPALNPEHTTALKFTWLPVSELADKQLYPNIGRQILTLYQSQPVQPHLGVLAQPYIH
jgi:8-oxo-dGTP diphosphatase